MARPRQFTESQVLEAAQNVFWAKGYEATSTRDLTEAMGLTNASLYNAFGDKRSLYLKTLDHYLDRSLRERMSRLEATLSPADAISGFFRETIQRSLNDAEHRGCMLVNTALGARPGDADMQCVVADETELIEAFFRRCAEAAQAAGAVPADTPPADIARLLLSVTLGIRVLARVRADPELLFGIVRPLLAKLGLPPIDLGAAS